MKKYNTFDEPPKFCYLYFYGDPNIGEGVALWKPVYYFVAFLRDIYIKYLEVRLWFERSRKS